MSENDNKTKRDLDRLMENEGRMILEVRKKRERE